MTWTAILAAVETIFTAIQALPFAKAFEEAELAALRAKYASNPMLLGILNSLAADLGL